MVPRNRGILTCRHDTYYQVLCRSYYTVPYRSNPASVPKIMRRSHTRLPPGNMSPIDRCRTQESIICPRWAPTMLLLFLPCNGDAEPELATKGYDSERLVNIRADRHHLYIRKRVLHTGRKHNPRIGSGTFRNITGRVWLG